MKAKKILGLILAFAMISTVFTMSVSAAYYEAAADELSSMGLFLGTDEGYELDKAPTRAEASIMLVRLLGKEADAKANNYKHPFTDVPEWAGAYVGYLYENALTKGVGDNRFGTESLCSAQMFCAFVLRALGYTEDNGDFFYYESVDFAVGLGLVNDLVLSSSTFDWDLYKYLEEEYDWTLAEIAAYEKSGETDEEYIKYLKSEIAYLENILSPENFENLFEFTRDHCVSIMFNALIVKINGTDSMLIEKLAADGAVNAETAKKFAEKVALVNELSEIINSLTAVMETEAMNQRFSFDMEQISFMSTYFYESEEIENIIKVMDMLLSVLKEEDGYTFDDFMAYLDEMNMNDAYDAAITTYEDFLAMIEEEGYTVEDYIAEIEAMLTMLEEMIESGGYTTSITKANVTIVGEDTAIVIYESFYGTQIEMSVYNTGGYIYMDFMGEKIKMSPEVAAVNGITSPVFMSFAEEIEYMFGDLSMVEVDSIEKTESNENITFTIVTSEYWYDNHYETITTIVFTAGVTGISVHSQEFANGEPDYEITTNITFISGDDVTIEFPDLSEYTEYTNEEFLKDFYQSIIGY